MLKRTGLSAILLIFTVGIFFIAGPILADEARERAEQANEALKDALDLGQPDVQFVKENLFYRDYGAIEGMLEGIYKQYQEDVLYESPLQKAYDLFDPASGITENLLDAWVNKTHSYIAYAARGIYKAKDGLAARGGEYISNTPRYKLEQMHQLHVEAAKDLQTAVKKRPKLMPAYAWLVQIAKTSTMPFTPREILDQALANDKRTYYVRFQYIVSLEPRWGGSYEMMTAFAEEAVEDVDLNPRLWSLQGDPHYDFGEVCWSRRDYTAAIAAFNLAMDYGERISWLNARGACYYYAGDLDAALADFDRVLYYSPGNRQALTWYRKLK